MEVKLMEVMGVLALLMNARKLGMEMFVGPNSYSVGCHKIRYSHSCPSENEL